MLKQFIILSVTANTNLPPCADNKSNQSEAHCDSANKDMWGQGSPGPGVAHSQGDMAHWFSPVLEGRNSQGESELGEGAWGGKQAYSKWGKMTISTQVPNATRFSLFWGFFCCRMQLETPLWLDSAWSLCLLTREKWGQPLRLSTNLKPL